MNQPKPFDRQLILRPTDCAFEKRAVLNPSVIQDGNELHIYTRAVAEDMISSIGYLKACYGDDGYELLERWTEPLMEPENDFERYGVEDPRVVKFEGRYHIFYTAYDGENACLGYACGYNPTGFSGRRLIGPLVRRRDALQWIKGNSRLEPHRRWWSSEPPDGLLWEKDASILPRRIGDKIVFIHRLRPDIQIAFLDDLDQLFDQDFWEDHICNLDRHILMSHQERWEESHMGMGPVPLETEEGWLLIYHGVNNHPAKTYRAGAALLDRDDPRRVIGRTREPLFEPVEQWEKVGDVDNVVFPEGLAVHNNILDIFYGGADTVIGRISVRLDHLLDYLKHGA